jgi:hypothetical protein
MDSTVKRIVEQLLASQQGPELSDDDGQRLNRLLRESEANRELAAQFLPDSESLAAEEISDISARRNRSVVPPRRFPTRLSRLAAALLLAGVLVLTRSGPGVVETADKPITKVRTVSAVAVLHVVETTAIPSGELGPGPLQFDTAMLAWTCLAAFSCCFAAR